MLVEVSGPLLVERRIEGGWQLAVEHVADGGEDACAALLPLLPVQSRTSFSRLSVSRRSRAATVQTAELGVCAAREG